MTHLPFFAGALAGIAMSTAFWFGVSVFWEAVGNREDESAKALPRGVRRGVGLLLVALALLPAYLLYRDESWPVLRGFGAGAAAALVLLVIELVRAGRSQGS